MASKLLLQVVVTVSLVVLVQQVSSTAAASKRFDIDYATKLFEDSMADKEAISLQLYLNGFKEMMKFFHSLGSIFSFAAADVEAKIELLQGYRDADPVYSTIQTAIDYETKANLLRDPKRLSAARTIIRLQRTLEFFSLLLTNISKLSYDSETAPTVRDAYSDTLAKYHPWATRTIISMALRMLPRKNALVETVANKESSQGETIVNEKLIALGTATGDLFSVVDKFYKANNIQDLP